MSSEKNGETTSQSIDDAETNAAPEKILSPAAQRALAEAEERRAQAEKETAERPVEDGGPAGLEPTRYGDWERKGIVSDF
ncbi:DUF1674 domain-containing protein [Asticcacaulis sp. AND118]|uniref:DUF1674 domain-containing protein n=1 Tax=Asticcacaulis sp. AND118 TaxID=2840468 RepID=UPI001CFF5590|nr:DUF1674 domain-containing protein [Asticcacaulis sp. AND118]UDF03471.1 DUF1674 domain-containing protein [Asticcacaulis sp. AND118]